MSLGLSIGLPFEQGVFGGATPLLLDFINDTYTTERTFSRGTGATRVNAAGLIVGVDFSSTSNTIATGSKTFTLTADANVNRDWPVGSSVIAVSQAGATGSMTGTVTSYTPSTQMLVINVASITGSGTSTNWRIGTLEFRRDFDPVTLAAKGGLVEGGATNLIRSSEQPTASPWLQTAVISSQDAFLSPNGSNNADSIVPTTANGGHSVEISVSSLSAIHTFTVYAKPNGYKFIAVNIIAGGNNAVWVDLETNATSNSLGGALIFSSQSIGNGYKRLSFTTTSALSPTSVQIYSAPTPGFVPTVGDGVSGIVIWGAQLEANSTATSYIPTTTVSVTRAADLLSVDSTRFSQFYNTTGTIVLEMTPIAAAVSAVAASLNDGTANNVIGVQRSSAGLAETPITTGGVLQANPTLGALPANATNKVAIRIAPNDVAVSVNGAAVVTDTSVTIPTVDRLSIGMNGVNGAHWGGWIRKITYSPSPMSDSELVSAST